jgi:putative PIN family toxin of toxin-antitoxin system
MSLTSRSPYHIIYKSLIQQKYTLVLSGEILLEYEEVVQRKYNVSTANALVSLLKELPNVRFQNTYYKWHLISIDEDDNKYVDCAIAGSANYLVTQDKHFQILKTINFPKVNIISIDEFILKLSKSLQKD